jgi:hypothetical protein
MSSNSVIAPYVMAIQGKVGLERQAGIDIGYDYHFERNWGRFERAVWIGLLTLLVLSMLGVLGRGPLNKVEKTLPDGTSVQYERVVRFKSPSTVDLTVPVVNGRATVEVDKKSALELGMQQVFPLPTQTMGSPQVGPMVFQSADPSAREVFIHISMQPGGLGAITSTYRINGQTDIKIKQIMVP